MQRRGEGKFFFPCLALKRVFEGQKLQVLEIVLVKSDFSFFFPQSTYRIGFAFPMNAAQYLFLFFFRWAFLWKCGVWIAFFFSSANSPLLRHLLSQEKYRKSQPALVALIPSGRTSSARPPFFSMITFLKRIDPDALYRANFQFFLGLSFLPPPYLREKWACLFGLLPFNSLQEKKRRRG